MIVLNNQGPWGGSGGNGNNGGNNGGGNNPWGNGPRPSGGRDNPDLEGMMREAQMRFKRKLRGGKPGENPTGVFLIGAVVLIAFWLATGFYRVEPDEDAVIMTFGKWTSTRDEAGLGYHIPYPFQNVEKVKVATDRRIEIGAGTASESMMLTGDENIIDTNFVVLWRIQDAKKYLFMIRDQEDTVKKVAESAMREIIGRMQIQKALTEARGEIEVQTKALMQRILDEYDSGVVINSVQLLRVDPPSPVVDAFDDVQRARTDLERLKNEAETYRNDIVPRARGEQQRMVQDAEGYKAAVISKAEGEAERFNSIYQAYSQSKDVTQKRIYIETMQDIMTKSKKVIIGDKNGAPVLPYMNIDQLKGEKK